MNTTREEIEAHFRDRFGGLTLDCTYWGEFHAHTNYSLDAYRLGDAGSPEEAYQYAKRRLPKEDGGPCLDFLALNDHAEIWNPTLLKELRQEHPEAEDPYWDSLLEIGRRHNVERPGRDERTFIVFPGWEYTNAKDAAVSGSREEYGHKNVIFKELDRGADLPPARYSAFKLRELNDAYFARTTTDLWKLLKPYRPARRGGVGTALTIMHTPAKGGHHANDHSSDIDVADPDFMRNVEVYSQHGNSEGPQPNGLFEEAPFFNDIENNNHEKTIRVLLHEKWCEAGDPAYILSFVAGTDNHSATPGTILTAEESGGDDASCFADHIEPFGGGKAGILSRELTRDGIWEGLWNRHTLGTSGPKLPVLFSVETPRKDALLMGDHTEERCASVHLRAVAPECIGTKVVDRIEIILDGYKVGQVQGSVLDYELDLDPERRHFVYVRVVLDDRDEQPGNRAWTSPVYLGPPA